MEEKFKTAAWYIKFAIGVFFIAKSAIYVFDRTSYIAGSKAYPLILVVLLVCFGMYLCFSIKNRVKAYSNKVSKELKIILLLPFLELLIGVLIMSIPMRNAVDINAVTYLITYITFLTVIFGIAAIINSQYLALKWKFIGIIGSLLLIAFLSLPGMFC